MARESVGGRSPCVSRLRGVRRVRATLRRSLPEIDGTGVGDRPVVVRSTSCATRTRSRTSSRRPCPTRCSVWATCTRRTGCGRWSSSAASATAASRRFSAPPPCRRIASFAPSASGAPRDAAWEQMPAWAKAQVNAYVAGVNAFIATHQGSRLPPEFTLLRFAARALVRRRRRRLGEDDGVGSQRELLVRAAAGRPRARGRRGTDAAADAAVRGRTA